MSRVRLLGAIGVLCAAAAFAAAPAAARPPHGAATIYPELLETAHFQIHYTGQISDVPNPDRILQQAAADLGANLERAYQLFVTTWGFPAPKNDGDGKVDVWVRALASGLKSWTTWETAPPTTVYLDVAPASAADAHTAAVVVMQAIQAGTWTPADTWLSEATAEWAAFAATDYTGVAGSQADPALSLDCETDTCDDLKARTHGHTRWIFFEYLTARYGPSIVKDIYAKGAELDDEALKGLDLLAKTLEAKGTTLTDVFNDFVATHVRSGYTPEDLKESTPQFYAQIPVGLATKALPVKRVPVGHLAARYVKFERDKSNNGPCFVAQLSVTVAMPAGTQSKPSFYETEGGSTTSSFMNVSGNTASITVPWSTCSSGGDLYVGLPNPGLAVEGQTFTVSGTLTVTAVSALPPSVPPPPAFAGRPEDVTPSAALADVAPSILVHGSEVVRVPAATRVVRLLVFSSGNGQLRASIGDLVLATVALRPGNNDVRFVLPAATVKGLRRVKRAASEATLTLSSLSTTGASGASVTRKLVVLAPKPAKAKTAKKSAAARR